MVSLVQEAAFEMCGSSSALFLPPLCLQLPPRVRPVGITQLLEGDALVQSQEISWDNVYSWC